MNDFERWERDLRRRELIETAVFMGLALGLVAFVTWVTS